MLERDARWFVGMLLCLAIASPARAQDEAPVEEDPDAPSAIAPSAVAASATSSPAAAQCSNVCPTTSSTVESSRGSDAGWLIIGIGGSVAASSVALGAALLAQGGTNDEIRLGNATLVAGITGVVISVAIGLIAM